MIRVTNVNRKILRQAAEKASSNITNRFPKLADWLSGDYYPSVKQLAEFAKAVHIPFVSEWKCLKTHLFPTPHFHEDKFREDRTITKDLDYLPR
ncbi:MAG: hypothetical protein U0586_13205 [Candidatus Brocadiaceae bacterium]